MSEHSIVKAVRSNWREITSCALPARRCGRVVRCFLTNFLRNFSTAGDWHQPASSEQILAVDDPIFAFNVEELQYA